MLTKEQFKHLLSTGPVLLDGATGSELQKAGMPRGCCTEQWVLENPEPLVALQRKYAAAGSQILYAPTFQAQPVALKRAGLEDKTELINETLVKLSRSAAPDCLIAGDLTTLATYMDSWDEEQFDVLVENYRRQIHGLMEGGADLLAAETLMYPNEAEAILTAAELEGASTVIYTFTMQADGSLFSGRDVGPILQNLMQAGAAAVGFNCVCADQFTPDLIRKLRTYTDGPLVCKPNAGNPVIGMDNLPHYPMLPDEFANIVKLCAQAGASLVGGCCGTTADHIKAVKEVL